MRRHDQEITDKETLEAILNQAPVCRIGLSDHDMPYVVPVNFGYKDGCVYIHSSQQGRKMEIVKRNPNVCFEVEVDVETVPGEIPCKWTVKFKSVIGFGKASIIEDPDEKRHALNVIMEHYSGIFDNSYNPKSFDLAAIIKIRIESMTGKGSKK